MRMLILLAFAWSLHSASAESPRQLMAKGRASYGAGDFVLAATNFAAAAAGAESAKLDPSVAVYNQGTAALKAGNFADAGKLYTDALRSPDLKLQHDAYFNRGNTLLEAAHGMEQMQKVEDASKSVGEAIQMYENAMALDPKDLDPKVNFELAVKKQAELEQKLKEQQQQQKQNQNDDQKKDDKKNDQQQQQQQQQDKGQDKQDSGKKDEDKNQQQKNENQDGAKEPPKQDESAAQPQPDKPEEMTKEEAALLLDAAKQQEQADREQIRLIMGQPVPVEKDW